MRVAWVWKSDSLLPNAQPTSETTPIMVNGVLYFTMDQRRIVIAAKAGTGETLWIYRPDEGERFDQAPRKIHRGVSYWTDGRGDERIFFVTPGFQLIALNAKNGVPVSNFGRQGIVDLFKELDLDYKGDPTGKIGNSSPVVISHDTIVVGPALTPGSRANKANVKGDVMAFDVRTGKKKWVFHTIPRKGEPGYETWLNGSAEYTGNAGVWGPFSVDTQLGYVYLNVESATNDPYGGSRHGNNLYSGSLVCLDIRTGKMIWYFQLVHHDIWDFDMPPHPILVDINVDGKPVKAVVQLSKQAFAYVFDRVTGKPVWPIDERPVPQTDVEGEWTAPTQPIPSKPPAFDLQGVTPDNIINFTPALKQTALQLLQGYKIRSDLHAADLIDGARCAQGLDSGSGLWRRGELGIGCGGSRDGFRVCGFDNRSENRPFEPQQQSDSDSRREQCLLRFRLHDGRRGSSASERPASDAASLWTDHGIRYEQRRDRVADSQWRYASEHQSQLHCGRPDEHPANG